MTRYDESFQGVEIAFEKEDLRETMGEVISKAGKTQVRIAETEKYPHVTFFFSGGREAPFPGERRLLCPSPKVATYDLKPEMSAEDIKDRIIQDISEHHPDFICLNFANPDMVGHTGVMDAAVKACETVDRCAEKSFLMQAIPSSFWRTMEMPTGWKTQTAVHIRHTHLPGTLFSFGSSSRNTNFVQRGIRRY